MDHLQDLNDIHNEEAMKAHRVLMQDMEMIDGEFECDDCGIALSKVSKSRLNAPMLLCGKCADWHKKFSHPLKMRGNYE